MERKSLSPEDYEEPRCLLGDEPFGKPSRVQSIPQQRVLEKLDEYLARRDYAGGERHLLYWLEEARQGQDRRGELLVLGELVGHYRKSGKREEAFSASAQVLRLVEALQMDDRPSGATAFINVATAYNAFGRDEEALALFEKALGICEASPRQDPALLGGLYNNMALCCQALGKFSDCRSLYEKALSQMALVPGGTPEQAITCLNMADAETLEKGPEASREAVSALLDRAWSLLQDPAAPRDGYYAFVCEKCAPGFAHYGEEERALALRRRSEEIYAGA